MTQTDGDVLSYYATPGPMTEAQDQAHLFAGLPKDIGALCEVVQGLMVHIFWAERYGLTLSEERKQEVQIRPVNHKLERLIALDDRPLTSARPLERKLVGNCRDFSVMLTAMLRCQGVPARARCGFGMYFSPSRGEDHWVCEYWRSDDQRWVMVDPQLDALQRRVLRIDFDPLDMPPGRFLIAGTVWDACRAGQDDPDRFGIFDMHGLQFIGGNVIRDMLALNKVEILPWDHWAWRPPDDAGGAKAAQLLDHMATLCQEANAGFAALRAFYESEPRLHMPPDLPPYPHA